jgi:heat shock protein HtpX
MRPTLAHSLMNWLHTAVLLGGMALVASICTTALFGAEAALWAMAGLGLAMLLTPAAPKELMLRLVRARPVAPWQFPDGIHLVRSLAERAALPRTPVLYLAPSPTPNAFAVGSPGDSAIVVTEGLLRLLDQRELAGVLAHEVSHIANRDLWVMGLADMLTRATGMFALTGQMLLFFNLPMALIGAPVLPWIVPLVLILAPVAMTLLQLALSRAREFDADLGAARLTGDPLGLASALTALERRSTSFWRLLFPMSREPDRSFLRTHPATRDRIARLRALAGGSGGPGRLTPPARPSPWARTPASGRGRALLRGSS